MRFASSEALRKALRIAAPTVEGPLNKYHAKTVVIDGIKFRSKAEGTRYCELRVLERAGAIKDLELQPSFVLAPGVTLNGVKKRSLRYIADFSYVDVSTGHRVVEDVKGDITPMYRAKQHLLKHIHGIEVKEIKR